MKSARLRKNSRPHQFLKGLALGTGLVVLSAMAPTSGAAIVRGLARDYFRRRRFERDIFLRDLANLQRRELVEYRELGGGKVEIAITKAGRAIVLRYDLDNLKLNTRSWDGKWRLVLFDIPNSLKVARDALREKLRDLEFYQLQKSVFITPYPCENEIDFIGQVFDVRRYILVLPLKHFEGEEKLRHHFRLHG